MKKFIFVTFMLLCTGVAQATESVVGKTLYDQAQNLLFKVLNAPVMQRAVAADDLTDETLIYNDEMSIEYHFKVGKVYYKITDFSKNEVEVAPLSGSISFTDLANGRPVYEDAGDIEIPAQVVVPAGYGQYTGKTYTVTGLGFGAFACISGITSVKMPHTVTYIGEGAFGLCVGCGSIKLSENLRNVGNLAFVGCIALKSIELPSSLTTLPTGAFMLCAGLKSVKISDNMAVIPDMTFYGCVKMENVIIPEGVTKIGALAFAFTSITEISLPSTLEWIGKVALYNDNENDLGLTDYEDYVFPDFVSVNVFATIPPIAGDMLEPDLTGTMEWDNPPLVDAYYFNDVAFEKATLYVPEGSVEDYRNAEIWENFTYINEGNFDVPDTPVFPSDPIMVGISTYTDNVMTGIIGIIFPKGEAQSGIVTVYKEGGYDIEKMVYQGVDVTRGMFNMENIYVGTDVPINQNTHFEIYVEKPADEQ